MNSIQTKRRADPRQAGFTLIELIMVIVILGILAAVAVPKFTDLSGDAEKAAANGVLGACQAATSMNFASNRAKGVATPDFANISSIMDVPAGWTATAKILTHSGKDSKTYIVTAGTETTLARATCIPSGTGWTVGDTF